MKPYKCTYCDKSFTQRCSLESHQDKIHGFKHKLAYKQRREKIYVCEECGFSTSDVRLVFYIKFHHIFPKKIFLIANKKISKKISKKYLISGSFERKSKIIFPKLYFWVENFIWNHFSEHYKHAREMHKADDSAISMMKACAAQSCCGASPIMKSSSSAGCCSSHAHAHATF